MSDGAGMQFERAEFDNTPPRACAECEAPLQGSYYDVNGAVVCEKCRYAIEERFTHGSPFGRFVRASAAGFVAAVLGALLYYAIAALTGYEFGLIAIVVGFAVGTAVRWGANGRGGWPYQALAIALTYLAIVCTYIPPMIEAFREEAREESTTSGGAPSNEAAGTSAAPGGHASTPAAASGGDAPSAAGAMVALVFLLALACVAPFLAGFENIIGLIIIGIGLYEAWKLNRRTELTISGPHLLARTTASIGG
jgi:hypothetical protein